MTDQLPPQPMTETAADKETAVRCPRCASTQIHAGKRGFNLAAGVLGMSKIKLTCLKCGYQFNPGRSQAQREENGKVIIVAGVIVVGAVIVFVVGKLVSRFFDLNWA